MRVWKLSESLDYVEILVTATFALKDNAKHSKFSRRTSYAQQVVERLESTYMSLVL
jgi:hypothetical protein